VLGFTCIGQITAPAVALQMSALANMCHLAQLRVWPRDAKCSFVIK